MSKVRPGSDVSPDEYDQEKEYDERFMVPEIFNTSLPIKPPVRKDHGIPIAIVIVSMTLIVILLVVVIIGIFREYIFH